MTIAIKNNTYNSIKDSNFIAIWGISHDNLLYNYLEKNKEIENINICFDNDIDGTITKDGEIIKNNHGQRRANEIKEILDGKYNVNILTPEEKDYNDVLRNMDKNYQDKKEIKIEEKEEKMGKDITREYLEEKLGLSKLSNEKLDELIGMVSFDELYNEKESELLKLLNEEQKSRENIKEENNIELKQNREDIEKVETKEDDYIDMEGNSSINENLSDEKKEIIKYQEEIEKITKNNAYKMLKAGIDVNTVHDITKYDKKELDKMQQEIVNQNQMSMYGLEIEQDLKLEDDCDIIMNI